MNKKIIGFKRDLLKTIYKEDIICALLFGSALFEKNPRDIDIYILFKEYNPKHLEHLRKIKKNYPEFDLTFQWFDQVQGIEKFRLGNQGSYYLQILSTAKTLYGDNIFTEKYKEKKLNITQKNDLLEKINDYFLRLDQAFINNKFKNKKYFFNKYISRILLDLLFIENELLIEKIHITNLKNRYNFIIKSKLFHDIKDDLKIFFSKNKINNYPSIRKFIYKTYIKLNAKYRSK